MPDKQNTKVSPDILIAGAGVIGLSIALELYYRGAQVTVIERNTALAQASTAAAGMLAADDPHNPPALHPLSQFSLPLYPAYLRRIEQLSGLTVPFQTATTLQYGPGNAVTPLAERSLDPRMLAAALLKAIRATTIDLREHTEVTDITEGPQVVIASGAWSRASHLKPSKGQMLRVRLSPGSALREVHRSEHVYIVPRTVGPQAGTALIGATVEDVGFDTTVALEDLAHLRSLAAEFVPEVRSEIEVPMIEAWAGLRPATPDGLPLLGRDPATNEILATGHFRNGILLAPATASVIADLIENKRPALDLSAFSPERFRP